MIAPRTVSVFGATGSVGTSTLDLIAREPEAFEVLAVTAGDDVDKLAAIAVTHRARRAVIANESRYGALKAALAGSGIEVAAGSEALIEAAQMGADWTMAAIVGCAGLAPTLAAVAGGKTVALANKEALVSAGDVMMAAVARSGAALLPVDSEHNAIFQCLASGGLDAVRKITLTASGGPFRTLSREAMRAVTPAQAVKHPNWSMGRKISIDSATMMNKGLELIEAYHLFPIGLERFSILVHPQSVIHSMVEYRDRSTIAQLGCPDMRIPIASALAWPQRMETPCEPLDLATLGRLDFEAPDEERFPALRLAREAIQAGGGAPAILNAANEIAVGAFLDGRIGFLDIGRIVEDVLARSDAGRIATLEDVQAIDRSARAMAEQLTAELIN
ncbi:MULTISPECIES: 1-deoxy-D-xylulose-5-phosphate reductoisomerase [Sphingobium]|uniref:1-deoxy-D-xylulose-5-phosphate reductoisomerase n=1 Tax=Sphingobium TaxID=165695 RepID=UPI0015EB77E5|nr:MULTISPECIES: 1-deoxy-D-xylulose-5-phosphate reductoisomerase [Sphingobium]MCW2362017.1 1-deoxy-D-xylulose-5-phosphate reductoisomerase [Sphingobium sp. B10D3B]MCW2401304.1 1-deoxy-D-xylulose-5-phosphate reductoisomerase [Sphingobium sp. B10D7B]MCW2408284.1 1-deoxy-D-xylulose-5-phosphate reductoisomerase [Sphingobium xanthum]